MKKVTVLFLGLILMLATVTATPTLTKVGTLPEPMVSQDRGWVPCVTDGSDIYCVGNGAMLDSWWNDYNFALGKMNLNTFQYTMITDLGAEYSYEQIQCGYFDGYIHCFIDAQSSATSFKITTTGTSLTKQTIDNTNSWSSACAWKPGTDQCWGVKSEQASPYYGHFFYYDESDNAITLLNDAPTPDASHPSNGWALPAGCIFLDSDRLFCVAQGGSGYYVDGIVYTISTNTAAQVADTSFSSLTTPLHYVDGNIYIVADHGGDHSDAPYIWNLETGIVSLGTEFPEIISLEYPNSITVGEKIYIMGGYDEAAENLNIYELNLNPQTCVPDWTCTRCEKTRCTQAVDSNNCGIPYDNSLTCHVQGGSGGNTVTTKVIEPVVEPKLTWWEKVIAWIKSLLS